MAINLAKNKDSLSNAWKDVLNDKSDTDWALFGYEGQTNNLKVVSTGSNGIEEMVEDLNSGKIMYAFVRVNDPKTSLPKYVLINWQGEGANTVRKGLCANHLRDVEKFFSGAHLTVSARNEDEVEPQLILDKVSRASGSVYNLKTPRQDNSGPVIPVGTVYKRVNPIQEINPRERDMFWLKEEQEEKNRVEEEKRRREAARQQAEKEVKQRELEEEARREALASRRNDSIDQIKEAEKLLFEQEKQRQATESVVDLDEKKVNQSDIMRQQRNQEAQNLISQRTIDARSIFEQNTVAGQMKKTPEKPVRASILKAQQQQQQQQTNQFVEKVEPVATKTEEPDPVQYNKVEDQPSDEEEDQFSTIKRSPRDVEKKSLSAQAQELFRNEVNKQERVEEKEEVVQQISEQQIVDEIIYGDFATPGLQARALYDYQAADDTEITFDPGDIITNIDQVDEGWWQGLGPDGTYGLFPANYVELIS